MTPIRILTLLLSSLHAQAAMADDAGSSSFNPMKGWLLDSGGTVSVPAEGLWSIGTGWHDDAADQWSFAGPTKSEVVGSWTVLSGIVKTPDGDWLVQDQYKRVRDDLVQAKRRWQFAGDRPSGPVVLSIEFQVNRVEDGEPLRTFLPGINYFGNPSGTGIEPNRVPTWTGKSGEIALYEEHRYPMWTPVTLSTACVAGIPKRGTSIGFQHTS